MIDEKKLIEEIRQEQRGLLRESEKDNFACEVLEQVIRIVNEQPKTDWIPVEERLPSEENELYLTFKSSDNIEVLRWTKKGFNTYRNEDGSYISSHEIKNIIAWQPIQPHKKEGVE